MRTIVLTHCPQDLPDDAAKAKRKPLLALIRESFNDYLRIVRFVNSLQLAFYKHRPTLMLMTTCKPAVLCMLHAGGCWRTQ